MQLRTYIKDTLLQPTISLCSLTPCAEEWRLSGLIDEAEDKTDGNSLTYVTQTTYLCALALPGRGVLFQT